MNASKLTWIDMDLHVETSLRGCVFFDANIAMEKDLHNTIAAGAKVYPQVVDKQSRLQNSS